MSRRMNPAFMLGLVHFALIFFDSALEKLIRDTIVRMKIIRLTRVIAHGLVCGNLLLFGKKIYTSLL